MMMMMMMMMDDIWNQNYFNCEKKFTILFVCWGGGRMA
jgi:hypothetical protein